MVYIHFISTNKGFQWDCIVDFMTYSTCEYKLHLPILLDATKQLIYISSARVYAESHFPLTEESPRLLDVCRDQDYLSTDEYALAKARQENLLFESSKRNWTIIRPYVTFDERRLQLSCEEKESWLYRALDGRTIVFSKDMAKRRTTFTYGGDVANGIASIIGKKDALGEAFHITSNQNYTWEEILDFYFGCIESCLGKRPKVLLTDRYKEYYGGTPRQVQYDRLYDRTFNNSKISRFCDVNTFTDTKSAIEKCMRQFIEHQVWRPINMKHEALKDRDTKEWMAIKDLYVNCILKDIARYLIYRCGLKK